MLMEVDKNKKLIYCTPLTDHFLLCFSFWKCKHIPLFSSCLWSRVVIQWFNSQQWWMSWLFTNTNHSHSLKKLGSPSHCSRAILSEHSFIGWWVNRLQYSSFNTWQWADCLCGSVDYNGKEDTKKENSNIQQAIYLKWGHWCITTK